MLGHYFIDLDLTTGSNDGSTMQNAFRSWSAFSTAKTISSVDGNTYVWIRKNVSYSLRSIPSSLYFYGTRDRKIIYSIWCTNYNIGFTGETIKDTPLIIDNLNLFTFDGYLAVSHSSVGRKIRFPDGTYRTIIGRCLRNKINLINPFVISNGCRMAIATFQNGRQIFVSVYLARLEGSDYYIYYFLPEVLDYSDPVSITAVNESTGSSDPSLGQALLLTGSQDKGFITNKIFNSNAIINCNIENDYYTDLCSSLGPGEGVDARLDWDDLTSPKEAMFPFILNGNYVNGVELGENVEINRIHFRRCGYDQYEIPAIKTRYNNIIRGCYNNGNTGVYTYNKTKIIDSCFIGSNHYDGTSDRMSLSLYNFGKCICENSYLGFGYNSRTDEWVGTINCGKLYYKASELNISYRTYNSILNLQKLYILNNNKLSLENILNSYIPDTNKPAVIRIENSYLDDEKFDGVILANELKVKIIEPSKAILNENLHYEISNLIPVSNTSNIILEGIYPANDVPCEYTFSFYAKANDMFIENPFSIETEIVENGTVLYNTHIELFSALSTIYEEQKFSIVILSSQNIRYRLKCKPIENDKIVEVTPIIKVTKILIE